MPSDKEGVVFPWGHLVELKDGPTFFLLDGTTISIKFRPDMVDAVNRNHLRLCKRESVMASPLALGQAIDAIRAEAKRKKEKP